MALCHPILGKQPLDSRLRGNDGEGDGKDGFYNAVALGSQAGFFDFPLLTSPAAVLLWGKLLDQRGVRRPSRRRRGDDKWLGN